MSPKGRHRRARQQLGLPTQSSGLEATNSVLTSKARHLDDQAERVGVAAHQRPSRSRPRLRERVTGSRLFRATSG